MSFFFYIARCRDGSLYSGSTADLQKREAMHNAGKGAKYTRGRTPVVIVHHERFATRGDALRREAEVKTWNKAAKEKLLLEHGCDGMMCAT